MSLPFSMLKTKIVLILFPTHKFGNGDNHFTQKHCSGWKLAHKRHTLRMQRQEKWTDNWNSFMLFYISGTIKVWPITIQLLAKAAISTEVFFRVKHWSWMRIPHLGASASFQNCNFYISKICGEKHRCTTCYDMYTCKNIMKKYDHL